MANWALHPWAPPSFFLLCPPPPLYVRACYWPQGILLPPVWGWAATTNPQWNMVFTTWVPEVERLVPPTPLVFQLDHPAQPCAVAEQPVADEQEQPAQLCAVAEQPVAAEQEQSVAAKKMPKSLKRKANEGLDPSGLVLLKLMPPSLLSLTRRKVPHPISYTHHHHSGPAIRKDKCLCWKNEFSTQICFEKMNSDNLPARIFPFVSQTNGLQSFWVQTTRIGDESLSFFFFFFC